VIPLLPFVILALSSVRALASPKPVPVWLLVVASDRRPVAIARRAKALAGVLPGEIVVQTRDCGEKKNVFAVVGSIFDSAESARAALPGLRAVAANAYVKRCEVIPRSLLSLRVSAVDLSIADTDDDVNWQDSDRVSSVVLLADGRVAILIRYVDDDPNSGDDRGQRVILAQGPSRRTLENNCPFSGGFSVLGGSVAFHCVCESVPEALLHNVLVFSDTGTKLADIPHCRSPRWSGPDVLVCDEESVDKTGRAKLRAKRIRLKDWKAPQGQGCAASEPH
jgi:hypothetical protein